MLGGAMQSLNATQAEAADAAQALATGQATDPTSVVMAVERAQLAMQLASQIRTKAVEAAREIFSTQV
jgi:flagellar hook-basal body complex protein FliE